MRIEYLPAVEVADILRSRPIKPLPAPQVTKDAAAETYPWCALFFILCRSLWDAVHDAGPPVDLIPAQR
jgi:hypothetical protein